MKARVLHLVFVLMIVGVLFSVGCGGSGSSGSPAMVHDSPVGKVEQIVSSWRASGGKVLTKNASGELRLVDAAAVTPYDRDGTTPPYDGTYGDLHEEFHEGHPEDFHEDFYEDDHDEYTEPIGTLVFKDLSGDSWTLNVMSVDYLSDANARVNTRYESYEKTLFAGLKIVFIMFKDRGEWFLYDIEIDTMPLEEVVIERYLVSGSVVKQRRVEGDASEAGVEMLLTNSLHSKLVYHSTSDDDGNFSFTVPAGNYNLSVSESASYMYSNPEQVVAVVVAGDYSLGSLQLVPRSEPSADNFSISGRIFKQPKLIDDIDEGNIVLTLASLANESFSVASLTTDSLGVFSFTNLPAGSYKLALLQDSAYKFSSDVETTISIIDQNSVFTEPLTVVPKTYVEGTTYEVTGSVNKLALKEGDSRLTPVEFNIVQLLDEEEMPLVFTYTTDINGDFAFDLPQGLYLAAVNPETTGYYNLGQPFTVGDTIVGDESGRYVFFKVEASAVEVEQIDLVPADKYVFTGYVSGGADENLSGAVIQLTHNLTEKTYSTVSREDGSYSVVVDEQGSYTMVVARDGYESYSDVVEVGEEGALPDDGSYYYSIRMQRK